MKEVKLIEDITCTDMLDNPINFPKGMYGLVDILYKVRCFDNNEEYSVPSDMFDENDKLRGPVFAADQTMLKNENSEVSGKRVRLYDKVSQGTIVIPIEYVEFPETKIIEY